MMELNWEYYSIVRYITHPTFRDKEDEYIVATPDRIAKGIDFVPLILQDGGVSPIHYQAGMSRSAPVGLLWHIIWFWERK